MKIILPNIFAVAPKITSRKTVFSRAALRARETRSRQNASEIDSRVNYLPDVMSPGEGKTVKAESFSPVLANFCTNGAFLHQPFIPQQNA